MLSYAANRAGEADGYVWNGEKCFKLNQLDDQGKEVNLFEPYEWPVLPDTMDFEWIFEENDLQTRKLIERWDFDEIYECQMKYPYYGTMWFCYTVTRIVKTNKIISCESILINLMHWHPERVIYD